MKRYLVSSLADHELMRDLRLIVTRDRATTAELLAHLGEVDARRLYRPAGYSSLYEYCVGELRMSEDVTLKRIQAVRATRTIPALLPAIADGRLNLSGVVLLAPRLTRENADELIAAAANQPRARIEMLLAERFPRPDVPTSVQPIAAPSSGDEHAPGHVPVTVPEQTPPAAGPSLTLAAPEPRPVDRGRVTPLAPQRYEVRFTADEELHAAMEQAFALMGHEVAPRDVPGLLKHALAALIAQREKRKFGATSRPRKRRSNGNGRYVPAQVRREVWKRDGGRCTFVSDSGRRCEARASLEFDHVDPMARDGQSTATNLRLRCRAHNQLAAEQTFGTAFMRGKREGERGRKEAARIQELEALQFEGRMADTGVAEVRKAEGGLASRLPVA